MLSSNFYFILQYYTLILKFKQIIIGGILYHENYKKNLNNGIEIFIIEIFLSMQLLQ